MLRLKLTLFSFFKLVLLSAATFSGAAFATTCTQPNDWVPGFCDLPVASSPRCVVSADNWIARGACVAGTVGCAEIGGCFGTVPVGHWYPFVDSGAQKRCQCGCFGEETEFVTSEGTITGTDLIAQSSGKSLKLLSLDSLFARSLSERDIKGVVFGPEKELVFSVSKETGRRVTLSAQHPVLVVNESGELQAVKAASKLDEGEFVLGEDGIADRVIGIEKKSYAKRMVNFNVASTDAQNHFVLANGIVLGDNAWQQHLASVDARILLRADLVKELSKSEGSRK
ncbi:hypothetical protein EBR21_16435 [bacterium]|nr:hypothetical protein [bacterium]